MADLYETLGVSRDANADEIKRAYRKLARELHPDINPDPKVQDKFKEVTNIFSCLTPRKLLESFSNASSDQVQLKRIVKGYACASGAKN